MEKIVCVPILLNHEISRNIDDYITVEFPFDLTTEMIFSKIKHDIIRVLKIEFDYLIVFKNNVVIGVIEND